MLYFVGTGLSPDSLSLRALKIIEKCSKIFLDGYTSILVSFEEMKSLLEDTLNGREIIQADRDTVERNDHIILDEARDHDVAFLVIGDAMCATTHSDLFLRARQQGIAVQVIPNASIINAISACGVEMYKVGRTISVPFFTETWRPMSFMDKVLVNNIAGLHSLMLMDIKTKELNIELYKRGVERYDPPTYMLCNTCCKQICEALDTPEFIGKMSKDNLAVCLMRVGTNSERYICSTIENIAAMSNE